MEKIKAIVKYESGTKNYPYEETIKIVNFDDVDAAIAFIQLCKNHVDGYLFGTVEYREEPDNDSCTDESGN